MVVALAGGLVPRAAAPRAQTRTAGMPPVLALLADGEIHSGERLAARLGLSRAAIWKAVGRLLALGIEVHAVARRGYRLAAPVELLDAERIRASLGVERGRRLWAFDLPFAVDSTNSRLSAAAPPPVGQFSICLTELQTAGRGRRGRPWRAPFGEAVALSLGWSAGDAARIGSALSLGVGMAVARALARVGVPGARLKWPNDIWLGERKVGGVLIEMKAEAGGPAHVVIGIGINVRLPESLRRELEAAGTRAAALADASPVPPARNALVAALIGEVLGMLDRFEREGFTAFQDEWRGLDALAGRSVCVHLGAQVIEGTARGVDHDGALLLDGVGGLRRIFSGEASLRVIEGAP